MLLFEKLSFTKLKMLGHEDFFEDIGAPPQGI